MTGIANRRQFVLSLGGFTLGAAAGGQAMALVPGQTSKASAAHSIGGVWGVRLDPQDKGEAEMWFSRRLESSGVLPSALADQGLGYPVSIDTPWTGDLFDRSWFSAPSYAEYRQPDNIKVPFWLQPEHYYKGAAWYQRSIEIPAQWAGRRVQLRLERPHWETAVWLDQKPVGRNDSLFTAHVYDLGQIKPGQHTLTIRVDNRLVVDIGSNSHGVSDHTQGNWNGIVGDIELIALEKVHIDDLQIHPDVSTKSIRFVGTISGEVQVGSKLDIRVGPRSVAVPVTSSGGRFAFAGDLKLGDGVRLWGEFDPHLLNLEASVSGVVIKTVRFGLRDIAVKDTQFEINGKRRYLRGTLDCCIFPKTGYPPTDVESWRRIVRVVKGHGLNYIRFHSYCPPEAAFVAMDEEGVYAQVELCWPSFSVSLGDGLPVDAWSYVETKRILAAYGNHPSFVLMAQGNEPGGKNHTRYLSEYVSYFKTFDTRRLWTAGAGWPEVPENQFHLPQRPRIQQWQEGLRSRINARAPETTTDYAAYIEARNVPVISHEIGQWCAYPNFDEMPKYTGSLKPKNFEIFRDRLEASGLLPLARDFLMASGKLQVLCYKEEIESALRTPGMGGFSLLGLQDFSGQGTALVGIVDAFWDEKGYVSPEDFRRFCSDTVPLARLKRRVFTTEETVEAELTVAHFAAEPLEHAEVSWDILNDEGVSVARGTLEPQKIEIGNSQVLGRISVACPKASQPKAYRLVVRISANHNQVAENDWDIWVYPSAAKPVQAEKVLLTSDWDDKAWAHLMAGKDVLLTLPPRRVRNYETAIYTGFSAIFWNTSWTTRQAPTTMGVLCDPDHPAFKLFPTDSHTNWQWWYLINRAGCLRLDVLPARPKPLVRMIDDWFTANDLALAFEVRVGDGRLIVCGFDLIDPMVNTDPVSAAMRDSLLSYMSGEHFRPELKLERSDVSGLLADQT